MKFQLLTILLSILILSSCNSSKNISSEDQKQLSGEMKKEGFVGGVIILSEVEGDCLYTIRTKGNISEYLDPINLDEEYKIDGQLIWFKFTSLRQENRCEKARPIEINEIRLQNH